jgi:hypothetical protein
MVTQAGLGGGHNPYVHSQSQELWTPTGARLRLSAVTITENADVTVTQLGTSPG